MICATAAAATATQAAAPCGAGGGRYGPGEHRVARAPASVRDLPL